MTMHLETRAIHAPAAALNGSRPVSVPIYQTSVFAFDDAAACARALDDPGAGFAYSRYANPTTGALEAVAADLEGGAAALATSSGMGAINAVLLGLLRPGDHVIAQQLPEKPDVQPPHRQVHGAIVKLVRREGVELFPGGHEQTLSGGPARRRPG